MSYPPQHGPYGQQPYGPQGGYPPPQPPPGPPPAGPPYWQQPYGQPPYGYGPPYGQGQYGPGPSGQPGGKPPKRRTGLIVGSAVAVVVLAGAFLITAFLAPGFLTGDGGDRSTAAGAPAAGREKPVDDTSAVDRSTPQPVAAAWAAGYNRHSAAAVRPYTCGGTVPAQARAIIERGRSTLRITGPAVIRGNSATVPVRFDTSTERMPLLKQDGQWCVSLDG